MDVLALLRRPSDLAFHGRVATPVEFSQEALAYIEDVVAIARRLTREAPHGRIVCGQPDPRLRELCVEGVRLTYRLEREQITVFSAERANELAH